MKIVSELGFACAAVLEIVGMGCYPWCLCIRSILPKYCNETLQLPYRLSIHIGEGKLKILQTNDKSEEVAHFYQIFLCIWDFHIDFIE